MTIAIIGASGYIGQNLLRTLLARTKHSVVALSKSAEAIPLQHERLSKRNVDVLQTVELTEALQGCDVAYYLVHMMGQKRLDYAVAEVQAAKSFATAIDAIKLSRVIYMGGLGNDQDNLSKHLRSRHESGKILRASTAKVIEFRASLIIGRGSIGYEIITNLVHKLPILGVPKWATTMTQPIGLPDALQYLVAALDVPLNGDVIVEIGGPTQLSYEDLMKRYAQWKGHKKYFVRITIIPVWLSALWLNLFTPRYHAKVGRAMAESLANPMVVTTTIAHDLFPDITPMKLEDVFV